MMKIKNSIIGKIGHFCVGPKLFINEKIMAGEIAICIAIDNAAAKQSVWLIGDIDDAIDYLATARSCGSISGKQAQYLLDIIYKIKIPRKPAEKLAHALSISIEDLNEALALSDILIKE